MMVEQQMKKQPQNSQELFKKCWKIHQQCFQVDNEVYWRSLVCRSMSIFFTVVLLFQCKPVCQSWQKWDFCSNLQMLIACEFSMKFLLWMCVRCSSKFVKTCCSEVSTEESSSPACVVLHNDIICQSLHFNVLKASSDITLFVVTDYEI